MHCLLYRSHLDKNMDEADRKCFVFEIIFSSNGCSRRYYLTDAETGGEMFQKYPVVLKKYNKKFDEVWDSSVAT